MKERTMIIIIVGIILVGLLIISGMTNFNFNFNDQTDDIQNTIDNSSQDNINNPSTPIENPQQPSNIKNNPDSQSKSSNGNNT